MQVILMEKVVNLGSLGDVVKVKDGFARNYLIPQGKAKRATEANLAKGNLVKVRFQDLGSTDYIFGFFLETGDFTLVSSDEQGGEMLSFSGRGVFSYLDRAEMDDAP